MSFEDLLAQTQNQNNFDDMNNALLELVNDTSNHNSLYNKFQPFLHHLHDGGNLNALCVHLQNPYNVNEILNRALVHNVVNSSKSNEKLRNVLEAVLRM